MSKNKDELVTMGRFISKILRHEPWLIGIKIEYCGGWANVDELINGIIKSGKHIDMEMLERIVRENNKQRYSFNEDKTKIRANQGHSIPVDLNLKEKIPHQRLYHGTAESSVQSIKEKGILKMKRNYVHLSKDIETAVNVGKRHGKPFVFELDTERMTKDNVKFYISENDVWLCGYVAPKYITEAVL